MTTMTTRQQLRFVLLSCDYLTADSSTEGVYILCLSFCFLSLYFFFVFFLQTYNLPTLL